MEKRSEGDGLFCMLGSHLLKSLTALQIYRVNEFQLVLPDKARYISR